MIDKHHQTSTNFDKRASYRIWRSVRLISAKPQAITPAMKRTSRPLRIAIYARYSSDLQNPSSVNDQIALCRNLAAEQFGIHETERCLIFSDAALTGATMERPGITNLLAAAKAGRIDMVVAEGLDRLSRSLKDIAALHELLGYYEAAIWTAHEGRINELHIGLKGTMNALYLRDMKDKVKRGQSARIAAGFATSSCPYGYRVVRGIVDERGRTVNGVREIDAETADVVRRIYDEFLSGRKIPKIVEGLNADGIPAPGGGLWKRNAIAGSPKKQEGILYNEVYIGNLIYNRTRIVRDPTTNKKRYVVNPESDWTKTHVPDMRIISDDVWEATRLLINKSPAQTGSKPREPKILNSHNQHALTGWVKCGWCGGAKSLANDTRYLCSTHRYAKKCKNARGTKEAHLLEAVYTAIEQRTNSENSFADQFCKAFIEDTLKRDRLTQQLSEADAKIHRLMNALENGIEEENVTWRILQLQDERKDIRAELAQEMPKDIPEESRIRESLNGAISEIRHCDDVERQRRSFNACSMKSC